MSKALELTAQTFEKEVLQSAVPVLVDFWAPWCGPCQMMGPILDELAGDLAGQVKIAKLDIENPLHQALAEKYFIMSIPNMKVFKNGEVVGDIIGARPKENLRSEIEAAVGK
jgi:thioredoxin 1